GAAMQPGSYELTLDKAGSRPIPMLRSLDSSRSILLPNYVAGDAAAGATVRDKSVLRFACAEGPCVLRELQQGGKNGAYQFLGPGPGRGDDAHVAEIALKGVKAD